MLELRESYCKNAKKPSTSDSTQNPKYKYISSQNNHYQKFQTEERHPLFLCNQLHNAEHRGVGEDQSGACPGPAGVGPTGEAQLQSEQCWGECSHTAAAKQWRCSSPG